MTVRNERLYINGNSLCREDIVSTSGNGALGVQFTHRTVRAVAVLKWTT